MTETPQKKPEPKPSGRAEPASPLHPLRSKGTQLLSF